MLTAIINSKFCIGCNRCVPACPVDAIVGTKQHMHTVLTQECIGCKLCLAPCPVDCIEIKPIDVMPSEKKQKATQAKQRYIARQARLTQQAPKALPVYINNKQKKLVISQYLDKVLN